MDSDFEGIWKIVQSLKRIWFHEVFFKKLIEC